ncbi:MAG: glucosaminidase domain-containing protein [Hyphomicrobium sp.]
MGETMMCRCGARSALYLATAVSAVVLSSSAFAGDLPPVKLSEANTVPECATPGRLSAFLEGRNKKMDEKFSTIAADYMRVGQELGIRWDTAFFQMLLETGNLTFTGDVSPDQNNFAGLGATGKKEPGETFPDVATGVKAHLQHLLMYAGETVDNPVAERTRKVQEWGVLTSWQKGLNGPMTYALLAKKWAPGSRNYARDIENVANSFYDGLCKSPDPKPEMMALVKPETAKSDEKTAGKTETVVAAVGEADADKAQPKVSGADLARRAVEEARASGSFVRSNLGAAGLAKTPEEAAAAAPAVTTDAKTQPAFKILNAQADEAAPGIAAETAPDAAVEAEAEAAASAKPAKKVGAKDKVQTAALGAGTKGAAAPAQADKAKSDDKSASSKCRVWTASYGGARAIIIRANAEETTNYTVLDVNEGTEKREADAYIAAYAKGGQSVGEFANQTQALDKAFELCPEG